MSTGLPPGPPAPASPGMPPVAPPPGAPGMRPGLPPIPPPPLGGAPLPGGPSGLGPQSPFGQLLTDLSADMSPGWQQVDLAARILKLTRKMPDMQKSPAVVAVISSTIETLTKLLSHYTSGRSGVPTGMVQTPGTSGEDNGPESSPPSDADGEPES